MASVKDIKAQIANLSINKQPQTITTEAQHCEATNINTQQIVRETTSTKVYRNLVAFLKELVPGKDFGKIPGVKEQVLFKKGALKILKHLGYRHSPTLVDKTIDVHENFLAYTVKVTIYNADDIIVAEALGSANTHEAKFIKSGLSSDSMLVEMAAKRALITCVKEIISK